MKKSESITDVTAEAKNGQISFTLTKTTGCLDTVIYSRWVNMREAGNHLGQKYRWMQQHYTELIRDGVLTYRVPKDSPKGRLMFEKGSLDRYMDSCRITANFDVLGNEKNDRA